MGTDPEQIEEQEQMQEEMSDSMMQQSQLQEPQSQSQLIINLVQRVISRIMQKQSLQQHVFIMNTEQQQKNATKRAIKMVPQMEEKDNEGDDERFIVRLEEGQGQRQKKMVWTTVFIQI